MKPTEVDLIELGKRFWKSFFTNFSVPQKHTAPRVTIGLRGEERVVQAGATFVTIWLCFAMVWPIWKKKKKKKKVMKSGAESQRGGILIDLAVVGLFV